MTGASRSTERRIAIAIVDDDASVRVSMRRLCEAYGLHASAYASGREFLAALATGDVDVDCLLLDVHMPEMTGAELHLDLVSRGIRIPTIVFSAADVAELPPYYATAGFAAYLRKPVLGEELLDAVDRAVHNGDAIA